MSGTKPGLTKAMLLKQYLRWLPAQLGWSNKGAFLLQIDEIRPNDLFVASYPKSGNTWLRFLIANMQSKGETIDFANIDHYVPDVYSAKPVLNAQVGRRIIKTHQALFGYYPRTIYIYRDYRDVLVSFYHYETALKHFTGTFGQFISSANVREPFGLWKDHVRKALAFKEAHPGRMMILSYEDLLENPLPRIADIAGFCGLEPVLSFEEIEARCSFAALKENEVKQQSEFMKVSNQHFFREGKKQNWSALFTKSSLDILKKDHELVRLMEQLGYIL